MAKDISGVDRLNPLTPGAYAPEAVSAGPIGTSLNLNIGGADITDSAGVIWLDATPYVDSPGALVGGTTSANETRTGLASVGFDQNDAAHIAILKSEFYDTSATRNAGPPGVLEFAITVQGNANYTLRLWNVEVVNANSATGARLMDFQIILNGTTATITTAYDPWLAAGEARFKPALLEHNFTVTQTASTTLHLELLGNAGALVDSNPSLMALELTATGVATIQAGPSTGVLRFRGHPVSLQSGLRVTPTPGLFSFKGQAPDAVQRIQEQPIAALLRFEGRAPSFSTGRVRSPTKGRFAFLGGVPDYTLLSPNVLSPTPGRMTFKGQVPEVKTSAVPWTDITADATSVWTSLTPDG